MSDKLQKLNKMYQDGVSADGDLYAEMRSNIKMVSGDHYQKKNWKWLSHVRENAEMNNEQKIRIMKNHTNKIYKTYVNRIVNMAPDTCIEPQNEKELPDQKAAELHKAIWDDIKEQTKFKGVVSKAASDYVGFGEVFYKIFWDWDKGTFKATEEGQVEESFDEATGTVVANKTSEDKHIFTGSVVFERIFAFNVFRPKNCQALDDAPWLGIQRMVELSELRKKYEGDEEKLRLLESDGKSTYLVFDQNQSNYSEVRDQVVLKEVFYRPSVEYPRGYFYQFTEQAMLEEGELPFGIFPIAYCGFDEIPTTPRHRSPIKQWKPYQVELNRIASTMAQHQITLGDDKLVITNGGKINNAASQPGVRVMTTNSSGSATVIPGRTGENYLPVYNATVEEFYQNAMVPEELEDKMSGQVDPYALLMMTSRWKTRFSQHIEKFEGFIVDMTKISLKLAKAFMEEDAFVKIVGKTEQANIAEFKSAPDLCYQIKVSPSSEDMESRIGKKMGLDRYLQYAGTNLSKEDIGKFIRLDPYLNKEQLFNDFTMAYDNAVNDILALDRGEQAVLAKYRYPDPSYILQKLSNRMGQSDFQYMQPNVQAMYEQTVQYYEQLIAQQAQEEAALNSQYIPMDGAFIRCDMWVQDPAKPEKQVRLSIPMSSLLWLKDRLEKQGLSLEAIQSQQKSVISDISRQLQANITQGQQGSQDPRAQAATPSDMPQGGAELMQALQGQQNMAGQP